MGGDRGFALLPEAAPSRGDRGEESRHIGVEVFDRGPGLGGPEVGLLGMMRWPTPRSGHACSAASACWSEEENVSQTLVHSQTTEEREYERWRVGIADRRRRVAELRAVLDELKRALERFEAACQARVGDLLIELRRLRHAIADHERRLDDLRDEPDREATPFETNDEAAPSSWWAAGATGPGGWGRAGQDAGQPETEAPLKVRPDRETRAELKRLYVDLAKRCHPDHARTDEERRRREALMPRVNAAFRDRDLTVLRTLWREAEAADPAFDARPLRDRLVWVRQEVAWLDAELADLRAEITILRHSEAHRRWRRHEAGEPVLDRLEDDLEAKLVAEGARLDALVAAYRQALGQHRRAGVAS